jgi:pilus assembly protein Flp/PilA
MLSLLCKFRRDQSGVTAIEYALIAALISIVAVTSYSSIGTSLTTKMTTVDTAMKN